MKVFTQNIEILHLLKPAVYVLSQYGAEDADSFLLSVNGVQIAANFCSFKP